MVNDTVIYAKDYSDYAEYLMSLISIPKNATNEDVLKIIFPNWEEKISTNGESIILERFTPYCKVQLHKDWLNAPYKKGD